MHTTYLSLKCDSCSGPLKYSSTSQSETGTGTLMHSYWLPQSESRPHRGPVCTFCAAFSLTWVGHRACSAPCPSSRLVVSSGAEWTGVHHLSAYEKEQSVMLRNNMLRIYMECWCGQPQFKAGSNLLLFSHFHLASNTSGNNAKNEWMFEGCIVY